MADAGFLLGAIGWEHPQWQGDFFPDGLPEDWRLAYYAHSFSCVLVPELVWRGASPIVIAGWERDTPRHFRFLIDLGSGESRDGTSLLAETLGEKFAGCVSGRLPRGIHDRKVELVWLRQVADLRRLALILGDLRRFPGLVFLLEDEHSLRRLRDAATLLELLGLSHGPVLV